MFFLIVDLWEQGSMLPERNESLLFLIIKWTSCEAKQVFSNHSKDDKVLIKIQISI